MWTKPPSILSLTVGNPQVWKAELEVDQQQLDACWENLSADEQERAKRFRFPKDKNHFIVARGILRLLLGRYLNQKPKKIVFDYGPQGKPFLPKNTSLHFNVSHSNGLALFAFAQNQPIGVDVEYIGKEVEVELVARHFFSSKEVKALLNLPLNQQTQGFFNCWTRKEAIIKALGTGLSFPLDQFEVSLKPGDPAALLATHWNPAEAQRWLMYSFWPGETYVGALAVDGPVKEVSYWKWPGFN